MTGSIRCHQIHGIQTCIDSRCCDFRSGVQINDVTGTSQASLRDMQIHAKHKQYEATHELHINIHLLAEILYLTWYQPHTKSHIP